MSVYLGSNMVSLRGGQPSGGGGGGVTLVPIAIRPDAEAWKTYTYDGWFVADEGGTIPSYSTSSVVLRATQTLETVTLDWHNYCHFLVAEGLVIPTYNTETIAKGRADHSDTVSMWEFIFIPKEKIKVKGGQASTSDLYQSAPLTALNKTVYWSTATAVGVCGAYGAYITPQTPSLSSNGNLTIKSPTFNMRGQTTYFPSTVWAQVTDIRYQYKITLYRSPIGNLNVDGWASTEGLLKIEDNYHNNNETLA